MCKLSGERVCHLVWPLEHVGADIFSDTEKASLRSQLDFEELFAQHIPMSAEWETEVCRRLQVLIERTNDHVAEVSDRLKGSGGKCEFCAKDLGDNGFWKFKKQAICEDCKNQTPLARTGLTKAKWTQGAGAYSVLHPNFDSNKHILSTTKRLGPLRFLDTTRFETINSSMKELSNRTNGQRVARDTVKAYNDRVALNRGKILADADSDNVDELLPLSVFDVLVFRLCPRCVKYVLSSLLTRLCSSSPVSFPPALGVFVLCRHSHSPPRSNAPRGHAKKWSSLHVLLRNRYIHVLEEAYSRCCSLAAPALSEAKIEVHTGFWLNNLPHSMEHTKELIVLESMTAHDNAEFFYARPSHCLVVRDGHRRDVWAIGHQLKELYPSVHPRRAGADGIESRASEIAQAVGSPVLFRPSAGSMIALPLNVDGMTEKVCTLRLCCLCVCVFACLRVCVFACLRVCVFACLRVCVFACLRVCVFACLRVCVFACLRVCVFACLWACLCLLLPSPSYAARVFLSLNQKGHGCCPSDTQSWSCSRPPA
jgi:hypothetical protein